MEGYEKQRIQKAYATSLSGLQDDPWLAQRVISTAALSPDTIVRRGRRTKDMLRAGFVFVLTLLLLVSAEFILLPAPQQDASLIHSDVHIPSQYATWPVQARVQLVQALMALGQIDASDATQHMADSSTSEAEKQRLADQLLTMLLQVEDPTQITFEAIADLLQDASSSWTTLQWDWWHVICTLFEQTATVPDPASASTHIATEQDAIRVGKAAIAQAYGFPEAYLDRTEASAMHYTTQERPDYVRWHVCFAFYREGTLNELSKMYEVVLDAQGQPIADPDINVAHVEQAASEYRSGLRQEQIIYMKYAEQADFAPFWEWPYTLKAAYSQEVWPLAILTESHPEQVSFSTVYAYGTPQGEELSYEDAITLAQQQLAYQYKLTDNMLAAYSLHYDAYDVTHAESPLWKFTFIDPSNYYGTWFRVEIDARQAQVTRIARGQWQERSWLDQNFDFQWLF